ncbi:acetylornithine deacetylase/succinyl-diaminopimelate desuccinylase-like protein [Novosphingobium kunmingense]|uniref:Acetylornithine deacetylase/succinyl-diaminopimelate desuccinylase-like protein n=1 Tax=Novosphingobium kunmingense TaxID=1211806 RepID=A0A2N0HJT7_9SPHN|nr:M20/M25/M40 family metallo-hydrolase [Novosphingobium kunmingense]PKB19213.1 acetylornithine deacetylase/succinyl-diaminopimelate desuccinylase-like protein [Novosphingobium kunmingense]
MKNSLVAATAALIAASPSAQAQTAPLRPDQAEFRGLYKELVETNTALSEGSCTLAAERMAARLKAAGMKDDQLHLLVAPEAPRDGSLVAVYPGTSKTLKPILLLAHIDVVEAKRSDWTRDPFTLIEENGYFYGRGTYDDKAQAAIFTDTLVRMAKAGAKPKRTIKLALTCGEETSGAFNGADWLARNKRDLIDAEFALNEGGGGLSDGKGKLIAQSIQVGEKAYQDFTLTTTNPGGHSSQPVRDNAIYAMADAVAKVRDYEFPLEFNDSTRTFFARSGAFRSDAMGKAMAALAANPADTAAEAVVNTDKMFHSMLRTTCVATLIDGGHAQNALPQKVTANINCRMFPGRTPDETQALLAAAIANPAVAIEQKVRGKPIAKVPPMTPAITGTMEKLAAKHFPGVPVLPKMLTGATDGVYLAAVGIPTYGTPGLWVDPDGNGTHGLNERIAVKSLMDGRDYLYDLVTTLAAR